MSRNHFFYGRIHDGRYWRGYISKGSSPFMTRRRSAANSAGVLPGIKTALFRRFREHIIRKRQGYRRIVSQCPGELIGFSCSSRKDDYQLRGSAASAASALFEVFISGSLALGSRLLCVTITSIGIFASSAEEELTETLHTPAVDMDTVRGKISKETGRLPVYPRTKVLLLTEFSFWSGSKTVTERSREPPGGIPQSTT